MGRRRILLQLSQTCFKTELLDVRARVNEHKVKIYTWLWIRQVEETESEWVDGELFSRSLAITLKFHWKKTY